jgi:ABC-2 type transport system permease protein
MKIIFKIARTELQNLFYSPVAWFLTVIFLLQCAYFFMVPFYTTAHIQDILFRTTNFKDWGDTSSLTGKIFFGSDGIVQNVYKNLYLFIPLLTMGLISREINTGTIKLLYSSPIKLRHIVLGKYLAVMTYILVLIAILGFFMISGAFHIQNIDYGWLLSALLGLCLLAGAYSAIGLFMSSLSNYQIVSGIATFMVLFILGRIGGLWQKYDFVRDLTWFLSIAGRTEQMLAGLITTRDVLYFIIVIFMFLSFTLFRLKGEKEAKPWTTKAARYLGVVVASLMVGYLTSRPALVGYLDATAENVNTIAPKTQEILKKMGKEPLEITLYSNLFSIKDSSDPSLPENRNAYLYGFWDRYVRFKPDIKFKYVYYYDNDGRTDDSSLYKSFPNKTELQIAGLTARRLDIDSAMFIPPTEIRKQIDPYREDLKLFMTARFKGDTINLRSLSEKTQESEKEIASKFKRLLVKKWPKVYFVTGNLERSLYKSGEREYSDHTINKTNTNSLINCAFDVDTLSLEKQDIPADITALVLADPKTELGRTTRTKLEQYIAGGGNLLVLGEPGKQAILNPVLQQLGVQLMKGQLVQSNPEETPDKITVALGKDAHDLSNYSQREGKAIDKKNYIDTAYTTWLFGATALSYQEKNSFSIHPIFKTMPPGYFEPSGRAQRSGQVFFRRETWLKMGRLVTDSVPPVFSPKDGDIREPFITALYLTRKVNNKEQRIIVMGDADIQSNLRLVKSAFHNNEFYNWLDYGEYPVYIPRTHYKDKVLTVTKPTAKILKNTYVLGLPVLLLLAGTILLIRRKRK